MSDTFAQRVERLKKNEKAWLFLSDADRDCIRQANRYGMIESLTFEGVWERNTTGFSLSDVGANEIFRIRPDYQPESEYVDLRIENVEAMRDALEAWKQYDSESGNKHPCPDYTLRVMYRDKARKLTEAALTQAKE